MTWVPIGGDTAPSPCATLLDRTIWPARWAQWPVVTVTSSTGPPGDGRPITPAFMGGTHGTSGGGGPAPASLGGGPAPVSGVGGPASAEGPGAGWVTSSTALTAWNGPAALV